VQDPEKPLNDGAIRLPTVTPGMNRIAPTSLNDSQDGKVRFLRAETKDQVEEDNEILGRARKRLERCISAEADNRRDGLDDDKFYSGDQWPADVRARRNSEKRPCLTMNKLPVLVKQVTNDQRQNRPTIDYHPIGDRGDIDVARIYRGLVRDIERQSRADRAYDTGYESAARKGWGYWRIITEYEAPDTFDQVIRVKRIRNAYSVYLDPDNTEIDGSDAKFGFITEMIERDEFKLKWPKADPMPWVMGGFGDSLKNWVDQYAIRIAEYYEIIQEERELVLLENGFEGWRDELKKEVLDKFSIVSSRRSLVPKIWWYKITAKDILERTEWPGRWIPIVKVIGDEIDIEGRVKLWGIIRQAKDAQRAYNYWRCLSISTPIPTPSGWTTMGQLKTGDKVFDENGAVCNIIGESPVHINRECFRVEFGNGTHIVADADHPWKVLDKVQKVSKIVWVPRVVNTRDLKPGDHFISQAAPLNLPESDFAIHPYLLGVWLGDGLTSEPQISAGDLDVEETRENIAKLGYPVGPIRVDHTANVFSVLGVRHYFTELGLLGNKYLPQKYLRASESQRWALLQGLMDTDGSINTKTYQCSFTTTNQKISDGMMELLTSLGIKGAIIYRNRGMMRLPGNVVRECADSHQISFSCPWWEEVFRLHRKASIQNKERPTHKLRTKGPHKIVAVERTVSTPVKCIKVDSESHLFLAGKGMIPTHNTSEMERVALAPKAPFIIAEGQLEGYEGSWKEANNKSFAFLPYKATEIHGHMVPPPQRQQPVGVDAGVVSAAQSAAQDMLTTTGVRFDATLNERTYDESGRALRELRRSGDIGSFNLIDNLMHSLRHTGEIFADLIPKIYNRPNRVLTILRDDDTDEQVRVDPFGSKPVHEDQNPETQRVMRAFDPTYGKYAVAVTIGPSYATRRIETAESMMDFLRAIPTSAPLIADLVAKNQDWEGSEEIATRLAKTLPPGLNQPEMRDVAPEIQAMLGQLQNQLQQMTQERQQLISQLNDRNQDRQLARERINRNFEVQLLGVVQKAQAAATKVAAEDRRAEADHLHDLAKEVLGLYTDLTKGSGERQEGAISNG
jgi:hypothetical protein